MKKAELEKKDKNAIKLLEAMAGGLIGVAVIAVFHLLGLPSLGKSLTVSLYGFAISIPLLSFNILAFIAESGYAYYENIWYHPLSFFLGALASLVGIGGLFFHFSIKLGVLFSVLVTLELVAYAHYRSA